jgi:hypothetical protein
MSGDVIIVKRWSYDQRASIHVLDQSVGECYNCQKDTAASAARWFTRYDRRIMLCIDCVHRAQGT